MHAFMMDIALAFSLGPNVPGQPDPDGPEPLNPGEQDPEQPEPRDPHAKMPAPMKS